MSTPNEKKSFIDKLKSIYNLKYFAIIISFLITLTGLIAIGIGSLRLSNGLLSVFGLFRGQEAHPGVHIIEAVDTLLFSVVILILGGGIFKLFVGDEDTFKESIVFSKIKTFKDLKILLWETLLLTLTVWCSLSFFAHPDDLRYTQLILPLTIVLLAIALKLMRDTKE
ncbi:YqhA family protein [Paucihalobacter ruber]|uniref:YqhA family protein n=1 Tax=Paucihalobacter ruber TaxID=2567861 RepID=A0A506PQR9_9FLAO|nr:YqhA family protein [Paucihalobacter ruber]TPV35602.1 YqhA family protein [Paucihalobacter ruber]